MSTAAQNCVRPLRCLAAHRPAKFGCRKLPATVRCPHFHPGLAAVPSRWSQTEPRSARVQTHTSAQTSTECSSFERTRVPSIEFPCPFFYGATPVYTFFLLTLGRNPFRNKHPGSSCNLFTNGCYSSGTTPSQADYAALWGLPTCACPTYNVTSAKVSSLCPRSPSWITRHAPKGTFSR